MKQIMKTKKIKDEIIQVSKHGGWAKMEMFINEQGSVWEEIELSIDRPLELVKPIEGKRWDHEKSAKRY